ALPEILGYPPRIRGTEENQQRLSAVLSCSSQPGAAPPATSGGACMDRERGCCAMRGCCQRGLWVDDTAGRILLQRPASGAGEGHRGRPRNRPHEGDDAVGGARGPLLGRSVDSRM